MNYDFASLCLYQLEKLNKRLNSINKSFVKEYETALMVINNAEANEHHTEIFIQIEDLLRDQINKVSILYNETFNKVQRELTKHLK